MNTSGKEELISVIIPVYNVERYVERCIESVIHQTYQNLEIILVDDGSTDDSGKICEMYRKVDDRIFVLHKENGGLADARNAGIRIAKGQYFGFVDSDDYIQKDMYEELYHAAKSTNFPIACCGRVHMYEEGINRAGYSKNSARKGIEYHVGAGRYNREEALKAFCLSDGMTSTVWDKLFEKRLFKNLSFPKGRLHEDLPVVYELYSRAEGVVHIGCEKYFYRHRSDSITGQKFNLRRLDSLFFAQNIYQDILTRYPQLREEAEFFYLEKIINSLNEIHNIQIRTEKYDAVEKKLRKVAIYYLFKFAFNPYIKGFWSSEFLVKLFFKTAHEK